jgi:hypothetical protein
MTHFRHWFRAAPFTLVSGSLCIAACSGSSDVTGENTDGGAATDLTGGGTMGASGVGTPTTSGGTLDLAVRSVWLQGLLTFSS